MKSQERFESGILSSSPSPDSAYDSANTRIAQSEENMLVETRDGCKLLPEWYQPNEYDIVCGRGKGMYQQRGNGYFRAIVLAHSKYYESLTKRDEKRTAIRAVLAIIRSQNNGDVRFVKQRPSQTCPSSTSKTRCRWEELGDNEAREKVSNALRAASGFAIGKTMNLDDSISFDASSCDGLNSTSIDNNATSLKMMKMMKMMKTNASASKNRDDLEAKGMKNKHKKQKFQHRLKMEQELADLSESLSLTQGGSQVDLAPILPSASYRLDLDHRILSAPHFASKLLTTVNNQNRYERSSDALTSFDGIGHRPVAVVDATKSYNSEEEGEEYTSNDVNYVGERYRTSSFHERMDFYPSSAQEPFVDHSTQLVALTLLNLVHGVPPENHQKQTKNGFVLSR